jgi:hypothetical protein
MHVAVRFCRCGTKQVLQAGGEQDAPGPHILQARLWAAAQGRREIEQAALVFDCRYLEALAIIIIIIIIIS